MLGLNERIRELSGRGKSINIAVAGLGQMGFSLVSHLSGLKGFRVCAVAEKNHEKADSFCRIFKDSYTKIYSCNVKNPGTSKIIFKDWRLNSSEVLDSAAKKNINDTIGRKGLAILNDATALPEIDCIDVVVDATGYTEAGAEIMLKSLFCGKDVVTLNVETDITIGPLLKEIASRKNLVYTLSAGDEPAVLKELYDFAESLGFKIICAGKGKNNPLDITANPSSLAEYAAKKGSSPKMMTSFVDGTKTMTEMACISNATGLVPDCRGMHGPSADIDDILSRFCHKSCGGLLGREGVVDFVIGNLAPGVFLVYSTDNNEVKKIIDYLNLGKGPNFLIYKPYHLTSIETPLSIARAYFDRKPWIVPGDSGLVSEVITIAKKDLKPGQIIDGIGGYTVYGLIDLYENADKQSCLPIGLSQNCILKKKKSKSEPVLVEDVEFTEETLLMQLRKFQDKNIQK